MSFFRTILILFFCVFNIFILVAQKGLISRTILNKSDSSIISHANIINTTSKIGITTNDDGKFTILTEPSDTLIISFIGFQTIAVKSSEIKTTIYLERAIYTIEPYIVLPYKNFKEFKEAFTNLTIEDTVKHKMNRSIITHIKPFDPSNLNGGLSFGGPISSIAAKFNKQIKDRKNYECLLLKDAYKLMLAKKFNATIIEQVTLLKNDTQIDSFMEYCDFNKNFIEFSSQYILFNQILNCFDEYNNLPNSD